MRENYALVSCQRSWVKRTNSGCGNVYDLLSGPLLGVSLQDSVSNIEIDQGRQKHGQGTGQAENRSHGGKQVLQILERQTDKYPQSQTLTNARMSKGP